MRILTVNDLQEAEDDPTCTNRCRASGGCKVAKFNAGKTHGQIDITISRTMLNLVKGLLVIQKLYLGKAFRPWTIARSC